MFFVIKKSEETNFKIYFTSQNSARIIQIMETQNIVNLLNDIDNENSKFETKNGMLLTVNQKVIIHS